jgi:hypothetical protein
VNLLFAIDKLNRSFRRYPAYSSYNWLLFIAVNVTEMEKSTKSQVHSD